MSRALGRSAKNRSRASLLVSLFVLGASWPTGAAACDSTCCLMLTRGGAGLLRKGGFQLQRKTRRDRMRAKLKEIREELRRRMHECITQQGQWLARVVRGYFNYHAVPTNAKSMGAFRHHVIDLWRRTLKRRSQKDRITWARAARLAADFLPAARILHPWPDARFAVNHPRWEPGA